MKAIIHAIFVALILCLLAGCDSPEDTGIRLLYWNIQNGMWDGQEDNYDRFVAWVTEQNPDICVWAEGQSNYVTNSASKMRREDRFLPGGWEELAERYGHSYWAIGGWRDNFPQVVTSKYPIETVSAIVGNGADSLVSHGSGWFAIKVEDKTLNIVTLHTWPQAYAYNVADREASSAENGGDKYRRLEVEYVCNHTINSVEGSASQYWMMMGDFNSVSRADNWYYRFPDQDDRFLVHDYVSGYTPYIDAVRFKHPGDTLISVGDAPKRIDFVYCTMPLFDRIRDARIVTDDYTTPIRDPQELSNFYHPSDHIPIIVDFDLAD